ncbi:MAG: rhamnose ABC transporter substrate-binding protein [Chloroflexota bacterium]|nr:rhamnose ABC transporter substrate-binding protein [Chloroflexota bacterium]
MKSYANVMRLMLMLALTLVTVGVIGFQATGVRAQGETTCAGEPFIGAPGGDAASPEAAESGNDVTAASPVAGADGESLNIVFLPKDVVNPYFGTVSIGGEAAAAELGGQYTVVGPQEANAAEQVTFIQTLTQQQVDAIVVAANDTNALAPALQEAMNQGIKVVAFDSDVAPEARMAFVNQADSEQIGRIQAQIMGRLLNCEGEIAILSAASTMTNQNTWISFIEDELAKPGFEGLELVEIAYGDDNPQLSYDRTIELLTAYPDLAGIISPTTVGMTAAAQAIAAEGRTGEVQLTGLNLPNLARESVRDGTVQEFALWNPSDLGYLAYYTAAAMVRGEITGAPGDTFEAGRLGTYTIGENSVILLGPPFIFDADNIDDFDF